MRNLWQIAAAGLIAASFTVQAEEISIRADVWYPHNGEPTSAAPGYMIEIAKAVLGPAGSSSTIKPCPGSARSR